MSNEITVKINCSLQEMYNILENKGFSIVDKFNLEDTYFIHKDIDVKKQPASEIFKEYILIRNITQFIPGDFINSFNLLKMTYKAKDISQDGSIIYQSKKDCEIKNKEQGKAFIEILGYKEVFTIKEKSFVYGKGKLKLDIKEIENGDNLIEIETVEDDVELDTIEKLKEKINSLRIPIDTSNYFVQKAESTLKKLI